jgi:hypothetical protein
MKLEFNKQAGVLDLNKLSGLFRSLVEQLRNKIIRCRYNPDMFEMYGYTTHPTIYCIKDGESVPMFGFGITAEPTQQMLNLKAFL